MAQRSRSLKRNQVEAAALLASGMKPKEVAEQLGLSTSTVNAWQKKEDFNAYFTALLMGAGKHRYAKALQVLEKQLDDANPWVAQGAARDLANRFEKAVTGVDNNKITVTLAGLPELGTPDNEESDDDEG